MERYLLFLATIVWCLLISERPALAYMDPGSGSMLLQLLLGGVAGVALIAKLYWRRLFSLVGLRRQDDSPAARSDAQGD
jgi:hypothetical protein